VPAATRRAVVAAVRTECSRYVDIARRFGVSLAFVSICAKRAGISRRRTKRPA
jgi:transposase-like protein